MKKQIIILAAGKSSRFNDPCSKLLQPLGSMAVVCHVVQAAYYAGLSTTVVLGHQRETIQSTIEQEFPGFCTFVTQKELRGTGDALISALKEMPTKDLIVANGDSPFITADLLLQFVNFCTAKSLDLGIIAAIAPNPFGYGRVMFSGQHNFEIIEEKNLEEHQKINKIINGGVYFFAENFIKNELDFIEKELAQQEFNKGKEFNITECINLGEKKRYVLGHFLANFDQVRGINSLDQYDEAKNIYSK